MALHVRFHHVLVMLVVSERMRTRPHNGHAPLQHVVKLREFIEASTAQEASQWRNPRVAIARLSDLPGTFLVDFHGTKLVYLKATTVDPSAVLLENHRPWRSQLDRQGNNQAHRQHQHRNKRTQYQIF